MQNNNLISISLILLLFILTLILILFKGKEKYISSQPPDPNLPEYKGPKKVGEDVFRKILDSASLVELNRFAHSSKANMNVVKSFLRSINPNLSLSILNDSGKYFVEIPVPTWDSLYQALKISSPNVPDKTIRLQTTNRHNNNLLTKYYLDKIMDIFRAMGTNYVQKFTYPMQDPLNPDAEFLDRSFTLVDFSNLPIVKNITQLDAAGKNIIFNIGKSINLKIVNISIFIRKGTNKEFEDTILSLMRQIGNFINENRKTIDPVNQRLFIGIKDLSDEGKIFTFIFPNIIHRDFEGLSNFENNSFNYSNYFSLYVINRGKKEVLENEEEEDSSSSSQSISINPSDLEIVSFIDRLKLTPRNKIFSLIENIGDSNLKRIFRDDVIGYLHSLNYSKFQEIFDKQAFNTMKQNPKIFTTNFITWILESLN